ncbi:MAG: dihydroorotate dehydrogenase electron transfer subunit [Myxococcota bacterium]|jgi:dihydroorotate dehydrogenase electron transfer subunit|nr:dihydroorotate dehydrogenase electron transfer subunit [Myxococcota bacterium]
MTNSNPPAPSRPLRVAAEVLENAVEGPGNHRLVLAIPGWPGAEPGQFVMLSPGGSSEAERTDPLLPRPMAVYRGHAAARGGRAEVEFLLKVTGRGTRLLADLAPGQSIRLVGPLGSAFAPVVPGKRAILVGGGTGIASLYELASRGAADAEVHVILGARSEGDLMGVDDFEALEVDCHITTEDGSRGRKGRVTDALAELLEAPGPPAELFACGPTPMMHACAKIAQEQRLECQVSLENNMACGFGVCLGCAVPVHSGGYSLVCRAGPVYPADQVVWEGLP